MSEAPPRPTLLRTSEGVPWPDKELRDARKGLEDALEGYERVAIVAIRRNPEDPELTDTLVTYVYRKGPRTSPLEWTGALHRLVRHFEDDDINEEGHKA